MGKVKNLGLRVERSVEKWVEGKEKGAPDKKKLKDIWERCQSSKYDNAKGNLIEILEKEFKEIDDLELKKGDLKDKTKVSDLKKHISDLP